jgi:hypothetical protein
MDSFSPVDQPALRAGNLRKKGASLSPSGAGLELSASANTVITPSRSEMTGSRLPQAEQ